MPSKKKMAAEATTRWYEADQDRGGMPAMMAYYDGYLAALSKREAVIHWWQRIRSWA